MPACLAEMHKDDGLVDCVQIEKWEVSLKEIIKKMDNSEFNILMAQMVIKASGQGIVGLDLTAGVAWLKELRNS